jgi:hypothetical protein
VNNNNNNNSSNNNDEEEEEPATTRLVQPSKILIPQDGQQPKKWRLADQRRYECKHFFFFVLCVFTFLNVITRALGILLSLFNDDDDDDAQKLSLSLSLSLAGPRRDAFFLSFFL